ncbi:hypothetical protein ACLIYP_01230 [Streptomyces nanhaiensis]|uniref:hypothetical protein n=1 Tax=Streptomyces nanhaiensis TaxID=679319 RepID=UPI00399CB0AB
MTSAPSLQQPRDIRTALSCAALIRLVGEIDDHGAIPARGLARILADLSADRIRQAVEQADSLGVLARTPGTVGLSAAGRDLADVYDATARWARRHNHPAAHCDFADRIRSTFALLGMPTADAWDPESEREAELGRIERLVAEWVRNHRTQRTRRIDGVAA